LRRTSVTSAPSPSSARPDEPPPEVEQPPPLSGLGQHTLVAPALTHAYPLGHVVPSSHGAVHAWVDPSVPHVFVMQASFDVQSAPRPPATSAPGRQ
jgi:hypothetical protein